MLQQIEEHKKEIAEVEEMHKILIKTIRNSSKYFTADGKPKKQESLKSNPIKKIILFLKTIYILKFKTL